MIHRHESADLSVEGCLEILGIEQLCQWDVLVFLHRRHASLAGGEQIARFLGYSSAAVTEALSHLDNLGLLRRSRVSQGVRFYEFRRPEDSPREDAFDCLLNLSDHRAGRLLLIDILRRDERPPRITLPRPTGGGGQPWLRVN